jgi:Mn2+/Fe2+ NRAMP family transporter
MSSVAEAAETIAPQPIPRALASSNPLAWLRVFGPGAVIASLTIGTGELIFSSRGGVIFGYNILFLFTLICLLKWTLAYSAARHMVISGAHPLERWMDLPWGPRGWLTVLFFLLAAAFIPVWVSFHSSVLGDFLAERTGTKQYLGGATIHLWGSTLLVGVFLLAMAGGYSALEKIQLAIVATMLAAVVIALLLFQPDWIEFLQGFIIPRRLEYPDWLLHDPRPAARLIAERPAWVELSLYAGVVGGAGYDYLAYASYIRDKQWGNAAPATQYAVVEVEKSDAGTSQRPALDDHTIRQWLRAPLVDCTLSFLIVLVFSAVFVASGKLVLGPEHQLPGDGAFLEFQAQFVTRIHPWLKPLYLLAAFLAIAGTLYGTLEVAPTVLRETALAVAPERLARSNSQRVRMLAIAWCTVGALVILAVNFVYQLRMGEEKLPGLTMLLIPVNLFTGVFACGVICLLNPWVDRRLPVRHRMPLALVALNLVGGVAFVLVALRGYWDFAGWWAMGILVAMLAVGIGATWFGNHLRRRG